MPCFPHTRVQRYFLKPNCGVAPCVFELCEVLLSSQSIFYQQSITIQLLTRHPQLQKHTAPHRPKLAPIWPGPLLHGPSCPLRPNFGGGCAIPCQPDHFQPALAVAKPGSVCRVAHTGVVAVPRTCRQPVLFFARAGSYMPWVCAPPPSLARNRPSGACLGVATTENSVQRGTRGASGADPVTGHCSLVQPRVGNRRLAHTCAHTPKIKFSRCYRGRFPTKRARHNDEPRRRRQHTRTHKILHQIHIHTARTRAVRTHTVTHTAATAWA